MITTIGELKQAKRRMKDILEKEGLYEQYRVVSRKLRRDKGYSIYIYEDSCPEFYEGTLYVAEIVDTLPWNLIYYTVKPSLDLVLRDLEDYINE